MTQLVLISIIEDRGSNPDIVKRMNAVILNCKPLNKVVIAF